MLYLVHSDFQGNPIGLWNEAGESFYPEENSLQKSATTIIDSQIDGESWEDFADRLGSRISHRDWWSTHESDQESLSDVWIEIVPSYESLNVR